MSAAVDEAGITRNWQQAFMLDTYVAAHDRPLLALLLGKAYASANFDWEEDPGSVLMQMEKDKRHWKSLAEARKQMQRYSY